MSKTETIRDGSITGDAIAARVRASLQLYAAWMERLWSQGQTSPDQGLAVQPGEVRRILADPDFEAEQYAQFLKEEEPARMAKAAGTTANALGTDAFWNTLADRFGLNPSEQDLLALCIAVEIDPRLGRVLAYVADDTRSTQPTAAIAAAVFGWANGLPAPMDGLVRWRLAHPVNAEPAWRAGTTWQADPAVVLSVKAGRWMDASLDRSAHSIEKKEIAGLPCLYPDLLARMQAELPAEMWDGKAGEIDAVLSGPDGTGKETLAAQYAASIGKPLLTVKAAMLIGAPANPASGGQEGAPEASVNAIPDARSEARMDALARAVRLAHVSGAILYWREAEGISAAEWTELKFLSGGFLRGMLEASPASTHSYALQPLPTAQRLAAWARWSADAAPAAVRSQRLSPAEIRQLAQNGSPAKGALRRSGPPRKELMQPLACPYEWDDLVVSPSLHRMLKDFEQQVQLRWEVYENWGFSRLTHLGKGISALFGGPSGTGKTMAAQVLARSLGLELYRVDLAGVVNKYIGETEKRLRDVFDACERSGALLFFDEADALFGSRMQVKDSHDRFANIEIDYLLQRIEQFDGIAILATNRKNDLDAAFLRRLRFVMDFLNPDKRERRILWEKSLPALSPGGEAIRDDVDFDVLAEELELNGAQIKAVALGAAFLARSRNERIGMEDIELAAHREYAKQGLLMRASLRNRGLTNCSLANSGSGKAALV
jgi:SpoVK/Ycf46/Vps4 family AAA+-type ATPase